MKIPFFHPALRISIVLIFIVFNVSVHDSYGTSRIIDASSGTQAQIDAAQPGDTLLFSPGDHDQIDVWDMVSTECTPLVIMSQDENNPAVINNTTQPGHPSFHIDKCEYVIVENIIVTGGITGIEVSFSEHIIIRDCEIKYIGLAGFKIRFLSNYVDFINNKIHHTGRTQPQYGEGIYLGSAQWKSYWPIPEDQPDINTHIWIEGNEIYECGFGEAIDAKSNIQHLTIKGNHIHDIYPGMEDVQTNEGAISVANGIEGSGDPADIWIEENIIEDVFWGSGDITNHAVNGSGLCSFGGGHYILNNAFGNCEEACIKYNDYMVKNEFILNPWFIYEYGNTFDNHTGSDFKLGGSSLLLPFIKNEEPGFSNPNSSQWWWCSEKYTLSVNAGSGDGSFAANRVIAIKADSAIRGMVFERWTGDTANVADIYSASTYYTMDTVDANVTATYRSLPVYTLTVNYGSGSGNYYQDEVISVSANEAPEGHEFDRWIGDVSTVAAYYMADTKLTMPDDSIIITATYKLKEYQLSTINGYGTGRYFEGDTIEIEAKAAREGKEFKEWTGDVSHVDQPDSSSTFVVMPAYKISVVANYQDILSGIPEVNARGFEIYPNPGDRLLTISMQGEYSMGIYTIDGTEIARYHQLYNKQTIDISSFPKGTLIIRVSNDHFIKSRKLIIR